MAGVLCEVSIPALAAVTAAAEAAALGALFVLLRSGQIATPI